MKNNKQEIINKYQKLKDFFDQYSSQFNLAKKVDQNNIDLKIEHSQRVVMNIEEISQNMGLTIKDQYLAKIIALCHDIGRFKQYKKYKTFSDYKSEDHASLGIELIKENRLMADFSEQEKNLIYQAILNHNKKDLDTKKFADQRELFFAKLIRDADKLDIFKIFVKRYQKREQKDYIIKLSTREEISEEIYNKTIRRETINYDRLQTVADLKVMQLGWIYDINFKETIEIIKKRNYLEIIYNSLPQNKMTQTLYQELNHYLKKEFDLE